MKKIGKFLFLFFYYLINFTWGILQNILGFCFFIAIKPKKKEFYHGSLASYHEGNWGGVSLGMFIFINGKKDEEWIRSTRVHEYGHTIQNLILGPLYLLVIGLPSAIWCNGKKYIKLRKEKGVSYFDFYPEKWANHLGALVTKEEAPKR